MIKNATYPKKIKLLDETGISLIILSTPLEPEPNNAIDIITQDIKQKLF